MNSFLLFIAGLLVLALSALFAAPYFIDWNDYRDVFEAQATKLIGRSVDVGGDVSLTLLPAPVLRFETVNVGDEKGNFDTPFAATKSVTVWLSVPPLLRGTVEARSIEIVQPVVNMRINEDGAGNWADLGGEAASLPFIPNDVALNSVRISDATVNIWRGKTEPDVSLDTVGGELTSRGLQGPYKFNGQFTLAGKTRELRLSTGKPEDDGEFRFNVGVRSPESRENFTIDGAVRGLSRVPVFKGTLKARLGDDSQSAKDGEGASEAKANAPFEIKSDMFAGLTGAQLDNFELTINKNDKPQSLKGLIDIKFEKGVVVGGSFSSTWLDIDSLLGKTDDKTPSLRASTDAVSSELLSRLSGVREGNLRFLVDQAVLSGDLMTNIQAELDISENTLEITRFSTRLPGDNRARIAGKLTRDDKGPSFSGPVSINGKTLSRLVRWAGVDVDSDLVAQQGDFQLAGDLSVRPDGFDLKEAKGDLFGAAFSGDVQYASGENASLSLSLNSDKIDLARMLGSKASALSLLSFWQGGENNAPAEGERTGQSLPGALKTEADVKIGAVTLAGLGDTAVDMKISFDRSSLDIRRLNLVSGTDAAIQAGGRLTGLDAKPDGNITLAIQANTGKGVVGIGEFLEIEDISDEASERVAALTPVLVTTAVKSGDAEAGGLDMQVEGSLGKSDLLMKMDLAGSPGEWRKANVALQASLSNASGVELLKQLRPGLDKSAADVFSGGSGTASLEANGVPGEGLVTKFVLAAGGTDVSAQGNYTFGATDNRFAGVASFSAKSTTAGLAVLGVHVPEGHGTESMTVGADIESDGAVYRIKNAKGSIGGTSFTGELSADATEERLRITAKLKSPEASLPRLLAPLVTWRAKGFASRDIRGVTQSQGFWPELPFNVRFIESVDGKLELEAEKLTVSGGLALSGATLTSALSDGKLSLSSLQAQVHGGTLQMRGALEVRGAGASLQLDGEGSGFRLADISKASDGTSLINAPGDLKFSVSGEGLTPKGLVSSLTGKGQLTILDGEINGFSLGAAHAAAVAAQNEKVEGKVDQDALGKRVAEQLSSSAMTFTQIKAPFSVNNGVMEFDKIALSDAEGRVIVATYLQLANLQLDSEWALQSAEGIEGSKPRVSLVFTGPLQELGTMRPKIDTTGLARYVTIQKMQKDVERLEKLDVSGPKPKKDTTKPKQPAAAPSNDAASPPEPAAVAQSSQDATPPAAEAPPPGPTPPLPARKKVEQPEPAAAAQAPATSQPPPVQPLIPGANPASDTPPAAASTAPAPSAEPQPVARVPGPDRKPQEPAAQPVTPVIPAQPAAPAVPAQPPVAAASAADVPQRLAPLPVRKPPVPRPAPVARSAPASAAPTTAPAQPAQAELPWLQSTTPSAVPPPPGNAQGPTQLPQPSAVPDQPQAAPPPSRPAERFDPFASNN